MASKQHQIKLTVSVGCISHNNQMTTILMFLPTMGGGGGGGEGGPLSLQLHKQCKQ